MGKTYTADSFKNVLGVDLVSTLLAKSTSVKKMTSNFNELTLSPLNYTWFTPTASTEATTLESVQLKATAGLISILVIDFNTSTGVKSIAYEIQKTVTDLYNNVIVNLPVKAGQYVGIYFNTAKTYYSTTGVYSDYSSSGKLAGVPLLSNNRAISIGFTFNNHSAPFKTYATEKTIVENETKFSGWDNTGFTVISNVIQSSTDGQSLTSYNRFGISNRTIEVLFTPASSSTKFIIATFPREGAINSGSAFRVNLTNNSVEILSRYSGAIGTVVQSFTPTFTLIANTKYKLFIELNGRVISLKIAKENTALGYKLFEDYEVLGEKISTPYGYTTYSTIWNYSAGTMQGSLRLINEAGGVKIISLLHTLKCSTSPLIYVCGDSITEGFSVDDNSKYGAILQDNYGKSNVTISGIGGAISVDSLIRVSTELTKLRPKYFIPYFGSNAESLSLFTSGMTALIELAISIGCEVILCTIPTNNALNVAINSLSVTYKLPVIDFRTLLTNAGVVYPEYYNNIDANGNSYTDSLHPNPLGHYMMANEIIKLINNL